MCVGNKPKLKVMTIIRRILVQKMGAGGCLGVLSGRVMLDGVGRLNLSDNLFTTWTGFKGVLNVGFQYKETF